MDRLSINLKTAARHGFMFAIVGSASWLGAGSTIQYIVTKHKTLQAAQRELKKLARNDCRIIATESFGC